MDERENLPAVTAAQGVAVLQKQRSSLVGRGLAAVNDMNMQQLSLTVEADAEKLFRQGKRFRYGEDGTQVDDEKAREYFTEAAELDHAEAQYELYQFLCEYGEENEGIVWLENSANLGFGPAQYEYATGFELPENEYDERITKAFSWYEERALAGDAERQFEFATIHLNGDVNVANRAQGLHWLKASAAQDYRPACRRLGNEYLRAKVTEHTTEQGIYWLIRAVDLGDTFSCRTLGDLYLYGHAGSKHGRLPNQRIKPDKKIAVAWYERGSAMDDYHSALKLGQLYLIGEYLEQDLPLAEKWLLHAANAGCIGAYSVLGREYLSGERLRQDSNAAIHWMRLEARSSGQACIKLASIYLDGKITPRNFDEAIKWLTSTSEVFRNDAMKFAQKQCADGLLSATEVAAIQSWLVAMAAKKIEAINNEEYPARGESNVFDLGELYEIGLGVEQDMEEAVAWYIHAAELDCKKAQTRLDELGIDWENT